MRLAVTGGSGFLGRELCAVARAAGHEVAQWSFSTRPGVPVDIRDAVQVARALAAFPCDVVVNAAYVQEGADAVAVTRDGAENVAHAAAGEGARLVHLSTDVVFDGRKGAPYVEEDRPRSVTVYGQAKAEAEQRVAAAAPGALLVRTSLIYGGPGHEPSKHELAARDPAASFYEDEIRCPVQVGDLAAALLELAGGELAGPLHVAGPDAVSRADFAELVTGRPVRRGPAPPGRPLDCRLDCGRALAVLGTQLRGVRSVLT